MMEINPAQRDEILASLQEHLARRHTDSISTAAIQKDQDELVWARQATIEKLVIPWIERVRPLCKLDVLEPGCGCGPGTCAFAQTGCRLSAYEIDPVMVRATEERLRILGLAADAFYLDITQTRRQLENRFPTGLDAVLLIGVLEHIQELPRLELMNLLWGLLRPNGLFVVAHSPNRLTYFDLHATRMPFGHMLPDEIAIRYYQHSPHDAYRLSMEWAHHQPKDQRVSMRHGFGTGLSFHDFQIAFWVDDIQSLVADDGLGPEMMAWYQDDLEGELLWRYIQSAHLPLSRGWSRQFLNLILRKP